MLYEDKYGNLMSSDELDELSEFEVEQREIHAYDNMFSHFTPDDTMAEFADK